jgi:hypothetical protein
MIHFLQLRPTPKVSRTSQNSATNWGQTLQYMKKKIHEIKVVECFPSMFETLDSISSTTKKREETRKLGSLLSKDMDHRGTCICVV